jgi:hypothetical protein
MKCANKDCQNSAYLPNLLCEECEAKEAKEAE